MAEFKSANQLARGETNDEHVNTWLPMATRIAFASFEESFVGSIFPYESPELAYALAALIDREDVYFPV